MPNLADLLLGDKFRLDPDALSSRKKPSTPGRTEIGLHDDRTLKRKASGRDKQHFLHVANAAKQIDAIPPVGHSLHGIMRGNFNAWDIVPALLQLAAPVVVNTLWVATLGFNKRNADELAALLDGGQVGGCNFICSCYFRDTSRGTFDHLHDELAKRGGSAVAIRSHAKILLLELTDGRGLVVETSANLRSCNNIEQFCLTNDRELLDFHSAWMFQVIAEAKANPVR